MDCPHIPELSYSQFGESLGNRIAGKRIPISGSLELTFRCNLRCQHCYVSHGNNGIPGQQELSTSEIKSIIDEVVDAGCLWFLLTGGEPLVRRDFLDIYTYAKLKGLIITLFTNGTLITPRIADYLADWPPFKVEITLYGFSQETYELVTGIPGSHARCMRGIELLSERRMPLKLKTMLMTLNQHEIHDMQAFADSLGVPFRHDAMLNAGLDGDGRPTSFRIPPHEVVQLDLQDQGRAEALRSFIQRTKGYQNPGDNLYVCGAGKTSFHIDPYGQLCLCMMARYASYDLRAGSFQDGWERFIPQIRSQIIEGDYACSQCELMPLCGQCPGWSYIEHGETQKPVDYLCQVAHLRYESLEVLEKP